MFLLGLLIGFLVGLVLGGVYLTQSVRNGVDVLKADVAHIKDKLP